MWRDGAIYFALIFASELVCVIISAVFGFGKTMIFKFAVWSIQNVVISHSTSSSIPVFYFLTDTIIVTLNLVEAVRGPSDGEILHTRASIYSPHTRPSMSTNNRRSTRRSGLQTSPIQFGSPVEFGSYPPSPLTIPRSVGLPNPHETSRTRLTQNQHQTHTYQTHTTTDDAWSPPYTESTFASPSKPLFTPSPSKSGFSPSKNGFSPGKKGGFSGKGKQPAGDDEGAQWLELDDVVQPGEWTEMYRSNGGSNEHIRVVAGPSSRLSTSHAQPPLQPYMENDRVLTVGTGNSRLLTRADYARPVVMSRADLDARHRPSQDKDEDEASVGLELDIERQTRLNELFEALSSPPPAPPVVVDHNRRFSTRAGFI